MPKKPRTDLRWNRSSQFVDEQQASSAAASSSSAVVEEVARNDPYGDVANDVARYDESKSVNQMD